MSDPSAPDMDCIPVIWMILSGVKLHRKFNEELPYHGIWQDELHPNE
jgi:hypothetical protein